MKKKLHIIFTTLIFTTMYANENKKEYVIVDGPFKNQIVQVTKECSLSNDLLQEKGVYDILLKRIADLQVRDKVNFNRALETAAINNSSLFEYLPDSVKKSAVCLCLIKNKKYPVNYYIDQRFLKEKNSTL